MIHELYKAYAHLKGFPSYGDKHASSGRLHINALDASIPNLKVIHIVRDIRDVHLSMKFWWSPKSVAKTSRIWKEQNEVCGAWGKRNSDRYLRIRYEDLTVTPDVVVEEISAFLGMPVMASPHATNKSKVAKVASLQVSHALMAGGIVANSEKWRSGMAPEDVALAESMTENLLVEYGYPLSGYSRPDDIARRILRQQVKDFFFIWCFHATFSRNSAVGFMGIVEFGNSRDEKFFVGPLRRVFSKICQP